MNANKLVYVPRNWKVNYVDSTGNEIETTLQGNAEYKITANGIPYYVAISGIRQEEEKVYLMVKVHMLPGYMYVMEKPTEESGKERFCIDDITSIERVASVYVKKRRSKKDMPEASTSEMFTFAFDSDKYTTQYRISVCKGEFVSLSVKDPENPNYGLRTLYGHIQDVTQDGIKIIRYTSTRGVRDIFEYTIDINNLIGIYRYTLEFMDYDEFMKQREEQRRAREKNEEATEASE